MYSCVGLIQKVVGELQVRQSIVHHGRRGPVGKSPFTIVVLQGTNDVYDCESSLNTTPLMDWKVRHSATAGVVPSDQFRSHLSFNDAGDIPQ